MAWRRRTRLAVAAVVAIAAFVGAFLGVGTLLVARSNRRVPPPPAHLGAETVVLASDSGERLAAWVFVPESPRAAVIVLHGVRANRADMLGRAELLRNAGFVVLTPDL